MRVLTCVVTLATCESRSVLTPPSSTWRAAVLLSTRSLTLPACALVRLDSVDSRLVTFCHEGKGKRGRASGTTEKGGGERACGAMRVAFEGCRPNVLLNPS
jgi:hypothetical protein